MLRLAHANSWVPGPRPATTVCALRPPGIRTGHPDARSTMTALTFGHIGVGVANIDAAVDWYSTVFGFKVLRPPFETAAAGGSSGEQAHDVLGADFRRMRQAFLVSGDGIGIELFQLVDPPHERR